MTELVRLPIRLATPEDRTGEVTQDLFLGFPNAFDTKRMIVGVEAIGSDREIAESELTVTKGVQQGLLLPEHPSEAVSEIDIGH